MPTARVEMGQCDFIAKRLHISIPEVQDIVGFLIMDKKLRGKINQDVGTVEIEQSLPGRVLGYGTIVAGDLEIHCVAKPGELCGLVERLSG